MRILVPGGGGQLGRSLVRVGRRLGHDVVAPARAELDLVGTRPRLEGIDAVINAAAYTAVDRAEQDISAAFAVNAVAAGMLAEACLEAGVPLVHVSTDFVFDGTTTAPLDETARPNPLGVYGASKLDGERRVIAAGGSVVRTSWLFGEGGRGFVAAIVRAARTKTTVEVVTDQRGCPTYVDHLAEALLAFAARPERPPLIHYRDRGPATRFELAVAIVAELQRLVPEVRCEVRGIATIARAGVARRPACTILDTALATALGAPPRWWHDGLARVVAHEVAA